MTAKEFRRAIQDSGLSFKAAAALMGISEPTMRRLVSPRREADIPLRDVLTLSAALAARGK